MSRRALSSVTLHVGPLKFPVRIYAARSERDGIRFSMLSPRGNRVRQCWKDEVTGEDVPRDTILSGFEYESGKFLKLTEEEMSSLAVPSDAIIHVREFVPISSVDRVRVSDVRYVELTAKSEETALQFLSLVHEMEATGRVGLVQYVARGKSRLCALRAYKGQLCLDELFYEEELLPGVTHPLSIDESDPHTLEVVQVARGLIESLSSPQFNPSRYKDDVTESIREKLVRKRLMESAEPGDLS